MAVEEKIQPQVTGPRHIIERPRLTRMLDETTVRIILLQAPAGYGKTTLAQQWTSAPGRRATWYRCTSASADVAALAVGLADAASKIIPGAGQRMRERLRASTQPEDDVDVLAELFAEDLAAWPQEAWLVVDDYHRAMDSPASEAYAEHLSTLEPLRMLVTTRRRPRWASARRIVYGEILQLRREHLGMTSNEARTVLGRLNTEHVVGDVIEHAQGWPAIIGLVGLAPQAADNRLLGVELTEFFAHELLSTADSQLRTFLTQLALAPRASFDLAERLYGREQAVSFVDDARRLGLLNSDETTGELELHPIFRSFLRQRLTDHSEDVTRLVDPLAQILMEEKRWDEVFELLVDFRRLELLIPLVEQSLPDLLADGRLATVETFVALAEDNRVDHAVLGLASAELAFREGAYVAAKTRAREAAASLGVAHPLHVRGLLRAGQAALMSDDHAESLELYTAAARAARSATDRREACAGRLFASLELDHPQAPELLAELEHLSDSSVDTELRTASARLLMATRTGGLERALERTRGLLPLLASADDPLARASFSNALAHVLAATARYRDALAVVTDHLAFAYQRRLTFAVSHAYITRAITHIGVRDYDTAAHDVRQILRFAEDAGDPYLHLNARILRARLLIARGLFDVAVDLTSIPLEPNQSAGMRSEYFGTRSLALACAGRRDRALEVASDAEKQGHWGRQGRVLAGAARAIVRLQQSHDPASAAEPLLELVERSGEADCFLCALRAYPDLARASLALAARRGLVLGILARADDTALARVVGTTIPDIRQAWAAALSKREREVYHLLRHGLSNRDIAAQLYISEQTVKVHLRHIYEKLGVRSRVEAVLLGGDDLLD